MGNLSHGGAPAKLPREHAVGYAGWHRRSDRALRKGRRLHRVGTYFALRHRLPQAEEFERLAVASLSDAAPGVARNQLLAEALTGLGQVARLRGRYAEAEDALQKALTLLPRTARQVRINALTGLGIVCKDTGRLLEAAQLYRRIDQELTQTGETDELALASLCHNQAGLAYMRGAFAKGEALARQAADIRTKAVGPDHVLVAQDESVLAANLAGQQRYEEAEALYRRALKCLRRQSPKDNYEIAVNLHGLAAALAGAGKHAEAERLYKKTLIVKRKLLGADHADLGLVLNNLGELLREQGRTAEAESSFRQCLSILEKALGSDHPTTLLAQRNRDANASATAPAEAQVA
jgi:tetratricopeptide (TPR) repeat protein